MKEDKGCNEERGGGGEERGKGFKRSDGWGSVVRGSVGWEHRGGGDWELKHPIGKHPVTSLLICNYPLASPSQMAPYKLLLKQPNPCG